MTPVCQFHSLAGNGSSAIQCGTWWPQHFPPKGQEWLLQNCFVGWGRRKGQSASFPQGAVCGTLETSACTRLLGGGEGQDELSVRFEGRSSFSPHSCMFISRPETRGTLVFGFEAEAAGRTNSFLGPFPSSSVPWATASSSVPWATTGPFES